MDTARVRQLARDHQAMAAGPASAEQLDSEAARQAEVQALDRLFHGLERECDAFCAAYNDAFGSVRVRSAAHADTVVVRSQVDLQDTVVLRRVLPSLTHGAQMEAHRYHYPEQPIDLPVGLRRGADGTLTLTYRERDITAEALATELLTTFTEQIVRAERRSVTASRHEGS